MSRKSSENSKKLKKQQQKISKICKLKSNADYTITILENDKTKLIPPYGELVIDKNNIAIKYEEDAKFLTFIK